MMVLTTAERQQLEALRKKAAAHHGLYVGDALRYAQLLGTEGPDKAEDHACRAQGPPRHVPPPRLEVVDVRRRASGDLVTASEEYAELT